MTKKREFDGRCLPRDECVLEDWEMGDKQHSGRLAFKFRTHSIHRQEQA